LKAGYETATDLGSAGNDLFMNFCDVNHEITEMQQEEKQQHQSAGINCMLMRC